MNLVGRVMVTDEDSSKVLPLLHEGFSLSAKVNVVNGALVMLNGDITLKKDGLCLVTRIPTNTILQVGDELVTSGEGGLFPAGIPIGVIESFDDSDPNHLSATLRPYASLADIKDVFILVPNPNADKQQETDPETSENTVPSSVPETSDNSETMDTAETNDTTVVTGGDTEA